MGKSYKRNSDDYDFEQVRESRKERKIRARKHDMYSESMTSGEKNR